MENPFESGHIRNYVLLYVSVVVIMVLFFIASTLFLNVKKVDKKVFDTNISEEKSLHVSSQKEEKQELPKKFKLLKNAY
jgi:signal transduction histidine kinase